jgi:8-oxo-dGTP diphosphatase
VARARPGDAAFILILSRARRILLVQKWDGTWGLPGGRIEKGESPRRAVRREVREETGLRLHDAELVVAKDRAGRREFVYAVAKSLVRGNLAGKTREILRQKWVRPSRARRLMTNGNVIRFDRALPKALRLFG